MKMTTLPCISGFIRNRSTFGPYLYFTLWMKQWALVVICSNHSTPHIMFKLYSNTWWFRNTSAMYVTYTLDHFQNRLIPQLKILNVCRLNSLHLCNIVNIDRGGGTSFSLFPTEKGKFSCTNTKVKLRLLQWKFTSFSHSYTGVSPAH